MNDRLTMLIVDDVEINRAILAQFFAEDYQIVEAGNGQEALDIIESQRIDIVMLDLVMPIMGGMELLSIMHKSEKLNQIPVIVTTSQGAVNSEVQAMERGAADFITKPYNPTIVRCRVHNVMARMENEWRKMEQAAQDVQLREMRHNIEIDRLTGIYNHEAFLAKAASMIQENRDVRYSIAYFNISCFKVINELFNMETGDMILRTAATYFKTIAGKRGIAGRISADQFAICVPKDMLDIELVLQGMDGVMNSLAIYRNLAFYAGIYNVDNIYISVSQMLDRAHMALNTVKGKYNERYAVYDERLRTTMIEEQMIVREMELALDSRQFTMYLQPVFDVETGKPVAAEALVRWIHPNQGMLRPDKFMAIFEKNGFIARLDHYMWEEACKFLSSQRDRGLPVIPISVNMSRLNLYDTGFIEILQGLLRKYNLKSSMLKLEITESAYIENPQQLIKVLKRLQAYGFQVMMDDFGSGYSSLDMLKNLPVDVLKIDMSFVHELEKSQRAAIIMKSIIQMTKWLEMDIIVEGVETKEQLDLLTELGCRKIQGYYFARPMPSGDCMEMLENLADEDIEG